MKALVTGGAGFIGSNLVRELLAAGMSVVVLDNLSSGHEQNLAPFPQVELVRGDVRDKETVEHAIQGSTFVFHLAASVGNKRSIEHPLEDSAINVLGTINLLEAACRAEVRKFIFSSSAGIFGELKTIPIDEDHPTNPDTPYGASKLCAEKLCLAYHRLYGLEAICLRYFNVYGTNQRYDAYGNVIPIFVKRVISEEPIVIFGDGEQTRDFVNVRDVARANYLAAMADGVSGAFNIASGTYVTIRDLARSISEASGVAPCVEYAEPRPGDVRHSLANIAAARDALGYRPGTALETGLREYITWAKLNI
jgi:UDP-glucose 4-epimerase